MKVDRIVGQQSGKTLADVLPQRVPAYEAWYDVRLFCPTGVSSDDIARMAQKAVHGLEKPGRLVSTRDADHKPYTFNHAVS